MQAGVIIDGRYRVVSVLGTGAQAVVVRAVQDPIEREVAVKVLGPDAPAARVQAALAEARLLASLDHPNLPRIYGAGRLGAGTFVAMELVDGPSLAAVLARRRRLAPEDAVPLFAQIAAALACAHRAGVVHRDVKPANVLLAPTPDGDVVAKLVDFGVAARIGATVPPSDLVGTPVYMAPEQATGAPADPRADQYALGVLMFRALTGFRPFPGDDALSAAVNHLTEEVPTFAEVAPELDLPDALEDIVRRCLEKDPERRFPDADALQDALTDLALGVFDEPTLPPDRWISPPEPPPKGWIVAGTLAAGVLLGLMLGLA
jgi:serine/threonine-protein kinase